MWAGHEDYLVDYAFVICTEWLNRGYQDTCLRKIAEIEAEEDWDDSTAPPWLGDERFHSSHRAALLWKNPDHYGQFGWSEAPQMNYYWPE
jgi:hypothetical protein